MGSRRQGRELALQTLYLHDTCALPLEGALEMVLKNSSSHPANDFCKHLIQGVSGRLPDIDASVARYAENWDLKRMATVDRNILRLAAFEILTDLDTPVSVIIDEAIEIAKTYSTVDSGKFVNGILDKVKQERKVGGDSQ